MPMTTSISVTLILRADATRWQSQVTAVRRRMLVSEMEDAMRRLAPSMVVVASGWRNLRQQYIDAAAEIMLFVEAGDNAAGQAEAQDSGTDGGGETEGT